MGAVLGWLGGRITIFLRETLLLGKVSDFDKIGFVGVILCDPLFWNVHIPSTEIGYSIRMGIGL